MKLEAAEFVDAEAGLIKYGGERLGPHDSSGMTRDGRRSSSRVTKSKMASTRTHDSKSCARKFAQNLCRRYARQPGHRCALTGDRDFNALQSGADVALRDIQSLLGEVFKAQAYRVARIFKRLIEGVSFGDDARQRGHNHGKALLGVGLQDHCEAPLFHSRARLLPRQQKTRPHPPRAFSFQGGRALSHADFRSGRSNRKFTALQLCRSSTTFVSIGAGTFMFAVNFRLIVDDRRQKALRLQDESKARAGQSRAHLHAEPDAAPGRGGSTPPRNVRTDPVSTFGPARAAYRPMDAMMAAMWPGWEL